MRTRHGPRYKLMAAIGSTIFVVTAVFLVYSMSYQTSSPGQNDFGMAMAPPATDQLAMLTKIDDSTMQAKTLAAIFSKASVFKTNDYAQMAAVAECEGCHRGEAVMAQVSGREDMTIAAKGYSPYATIIDQVGIFVQETARVLHVPDTFASAKAQAFGKETMVLTTAILTDVGFQTPTEYTASSKVDSSTVLAGSSQQVLRLKVGTLGMVSGKMTFAGVGGTGCGSSFLVT